MSVAPITANSTAAGLARFDRTKPPQAEQAKAAAGQFEAILLRQFLNESVGSLVGKSDTPEGNVYGYMLTDTLAQNLTAHGGLGLGKILERQLLPPAKPAVKPSTP